MFIFEILTFILKVVTYVLYGSTDQNYKICKTDQCVNTAANVLSNLNLTVDPCDDFYQFACGGWIANNQLTSSSQIDQFKIAGENVAERLKIILEDKQQPTDTVALGYAREMYNMCMNSDTTESDEITALDRFSQRFGAWPITLPISEWNADNVSWQEMTKKMHDNFFQNGLFTVGIEINPNKSDSYVISIDQPNLYFPFRANYEDLNNDIEKKELFIYYIETVARIFAQNRGSDVDDETIAEDARSMVDFEIDLAKGKKNFAEIIEANDSYISPTLEEWQEIYNRNVTNYEKNGINWYDLLQRIFGPLGITILQSDIIMAPKWPFFSHLVSLLDRTPIRTIVNYMQWNFIRQRAAYTTLQLQNIQTQFKIFMGLSSSEGKWKGCMEEFMCAPEECKASLNTAISYEYAKRYEPEGEKENVKEMVSDIADVIREKISSSTWMDKQTKKVSIDKMNYMTSYISTPDWYSKEAIDQLFENLTITPETGYVDNMLKLQIYKRQHVLSRLRKPVEDKKMWLMNTPLVANAFYEPKTNAMLFPLAVLQDPFYNVNRPMVMNYAAIGQVIGHEINHGFDNSGSRYDKNGHKVKWWTEEAINNFKPIKQCFIDQYNGYTVPGLEEVVYVEGKYTLGENMADTAGAKAAFKAYKNKKARLHQPEMRLPGQLEIYSEDQIFFISYAQMWCENVSPQLIRQRLSDEHPLSEVRVRGTVSNVAEFSEAYKCSDKAKLNPGKKCNLWQ